MVFDPHNPYPFQNGNGTESKLARLEAHFYHLWQRQSALDQEIEDLKRDRAALIKTIGKWVIYALGALIVSILSKGSTLGSLVQNLLSMIASS